jgi:hypothetical protein
MRFLGYTLVFGYTLGFFMDSILVFWLHYGFLSGLHPSFLVTLWASGLHSELLGHTLVFGLQSGFLSEFHPIFGLHYWLLIKLPNFL